MDIPSVNYELNAHNSYIKGYPITIKFTLNNLSDENLWVLTWYTPLEGLRGNIFRIVCDGNEIPYVGPMVKRGQPKEGDYISISQTQSISVNVDLSVGYDIPVSNECNVEFKGKIYDLKICDNAKSDHGPAIIVGNIITFNVLPKS